MRPLKIENVKCISCNKCVEICISKNIQKIEGKYQILETECVGCGHCIAICPVEAITGEKPAVPFEKAELKEKSVIDLLRSRRSTRLYKKEKISKEILEKLIDVACYAPSGCNCQCWEFSVITSPEILRELKEMSLVFYRGVIKLCGPDIPEEKRPIKNNAVIELLQHLVKNLEECKDNLLYNAPALVVVHADKNSITPQENCCYALYNMVILAHSLGIGSCINGLIAIAVNGYKAMREKIGIPETNQAYAASTFGYPLYELQRIPKRQDAKIRWY